MYPEKVQLSNVANLQVIREIPTAVEGDLKARRLVTQNNAYEVDGIFFLREQVAPSQLVPGLLMEGNHIAVDRKMATNLAGCFACGDVVGTPYQYIKAAGEGNVAALSAVRYLGGNTNGKENF
jgi:thioredoxin reductase (NADPH)